MLDFDFFCDSYCSIYIKYLSLIQKYLHVKFASYAKMSFITPLPATTPTRSRSSQVTCIASWTFFFLNHPFLLFLF